MSQQGTWCDNLIIQAVAEKLNIIIHITESNPLFTEISVIEPLHFIEGVRAIHLGHIDELHYVSTVQLDFAPSPINNNTVLVTSKTNCTLSKENDLKRKRNAYMREYRNEEPDRNIKNHNAYMKKIKS